MNNDLPMTPQETFGLLLRNFRRMNNITQKEVAEHLFITRSAYSHYESGKRLPSLTILIRICSYIDADPAVLLLPLLSDKNFSGKPHPNVRNKKSNYSKLIQKKPDITSLSSQEQVAVDSFILCLKNLTK